MISIRELADQVGSSIESVVKFIKKKKEFAITEDGENAIHLLSLQKQIKSEILSRHQIDPEVEATKWNISPDIVRRLLKRIGLNLDEYESTFYYLPHSLKQDIFEEVESKGCVDVAGYAEDMNIPTKLLLKRVSKNLPPNYGIIRGTSVIATTEWIYEAERKFILSQVETPVIRDEKADVKVLRGGEFVGNRFRFKVKVVNNGKYVITDITVMMLTYPKDSLRLDSEDTKKISKIDPEGFRSPSFEFLPTSDCVKGSLIATVSLMDHLGRLTTQHTEAFTIRAVCDLLRPETLTHSEFLQKLILMKNSEMLSRIEDWTPEEMHAKTLQVLKGSNFFQVTDELEREGEHIEIETEGWARGKYTGKPLGVKITITGKSKELGATCRVRIFGEDDSMIIPAMDEITQNLTAWLCPICGGKLEDAKIQNLKAGNPVSCSFCNATIER